VDQAVFNAAPKSATNNYVIYTKSEHVVVNRNTGLWLVTIKHLDSTNSRRTIQLKADP